MLGLGRDILRLVSTGVTGGGAPSDPGYTPPLDVYPADIAYSVRKLSSSYTGPAIEVERDPGGETQDIYFDSNGLVDTTALATFAAGAELRVKTLYDQTGNGRHATTTVSTDMSYIYSGTAVYETNEIPVITPRGATDGFYPITGTYSTAANNTVFAVLSAGHTNGSYLMARGSFGGSGILMGGIACPTSGCTSGPDYGFGTTQYYRDGVYYGGTGTGLTRDDFAQSSISSQRIYGVGFTQSGLNAINMSRAGNTSIYATQEYIVYFSDQLGTTPRQALEQNLNSYYRSSNLPDYTSGFLADYPNAAAAYSVRQLSNTAIKCMRVRRAVPPYDEQDIGFTAGGDLDEAAIVAFGGSDVLNVSAWYDQSGNSNHATQIAPNSQPQIYDGTSVNLLNGKPAIDLDEAALTTTLTSISQPYTLSAVIATNDTGARLLGNNLQLIAQSSTDFYWLNANTQGFTYSLNTQTLFSGVGDGANSIAKLSDASSQPSATTLNKTSSLNMAIMLARLNANSVFNEATCQEFIVWDSNQNSSSNLSSIESNINSYFDIYTEYNPDPATSGFLFDYPDASVAYSVRQLNNNATYAMRVRRTVDPFDELDIGFVNGDLDTSAISTFGGSDSLTVSRWYDQSGNLRNATPPSTGAQPQIYDGVSVELENGKPVMAPLNNNTQFRVSLDLVGDFVDMFAVQQRYSNLSMGFGTTSINNTWFGYARNASGSASGPSDSMEYGIDGGALEALKTRLSLYDDTANQTLVYYRNPNPSKPFSASWTDFVLGYHTGGISMPRFQEVILWQNDDQTDNRTAIETDIDTYYQIPGM